MLKRSLLILISIFFVVACTPTETDTPAQSSDDTDVTVTEEASSDDTTENTDDTSTDDTADNTPTGISVTITGDAELSFDGGVALSNTQSDTAMQFSFIQDFQSTGTNITLTGVPYVDSMPTTLELGSENRAGETLTASFVDSRDDNFVAYSENVSGTLTIDTLDTTMTGVLSFTAEDTEGNSVTVEVTFDSISVPE
ncbi:MAG: hypothetical protein AAFR67_00470 [Chloroflexota bacterium]